MGNAIPFSLFLSKQGQPLGLQTLLENWCVDTRQQIGDCFSSDDQHHRILTGSWREERKLLKECEGERKRVGDRRRKKEGMVNRGLINVFIIYLRKERVDMLQLSLPAEKRTEDLWETCSSSINLMWDMWEKYQLKSVVKMMTDLL